jgi:hypothetical protein
MYYLRKRLAGCVQTAKGPLCSRWFNLKGRVASRLNIM